MSEHDDAEEYRLWMAKAMIEAFEAEQLDNLPLTPDGKVDPAAWERITKRTRWVRVVEQRREGPPEPTDLRSALRRRES